MYKIINRKEFKDWFYVYVYVYVYVADSFQARITVWKVDFLNICYLFSSVLHCDKTWQAFENTREV